MSTQSVAKNTALMTTASVLQKVISFAYFTIVARSIGAEGTGNLLVVKTLAGGAQAVSEALDWEEWPEVLGTLGGDDTILLVLRDAAHLPEIQRRIEELAQADI